MVKNVTVGDIEGYLGFSEADRHFILRFNTFEGARRFGETMAKKLGVDIPGPERRAATYLEDIFGVVPVGQESYLFISKKYRALFEEYMGKVSEEL
jgi:hypothetical protein